MNFKRNVIALGVVLTSFAFITTGCNTVKGTVNGAGQDIQSVGHAMAPSKPVHHVKRKPVKKHHHMKHHKKMTTTKTTKMSDNMDSSKDSNMNDSSSSTTTTTDTSATDNSVN